MQRIFQIVSRRAFAAPRALLRPAVPASHFQRSFHLSPIAWKASWTPGRDVSYQELKPITQQPTDDVLVIDVREPDEVVQGNIPSSVNLPLSQLEKALATDEGDFMKRHSFRKPSKQQKIIVYCKTGRRSQSALEYLVKKGYTNVRNYRGSWTDWSANESNPADVHGISNQEASV